MLMLNSACFAQCHEILQPVLTIQSFASSFAGDEPHPEAPWAHRERGGVLPPEKWGWTPPPSKQPTHVNRAQGTILHNPDTICGRSRAPAVIHIDMLCDSESEIRDLECAAEVEVKRGPSADWAEIPMCSDRKTTGYNVRTPSHLIYLLRDID